MGILSLFKKQYTPKPIFEALGTDMHCHLIPRVDDGSKCIEESIECLNTLKAVGYKKVIITPHFQHPRFNNDEDDIRQRYEEVKRQAAEAGVEIEIAGIGGEYRIDSGFKNRLENPRFLKVGGKYVLIEFSLHQQMMGVDEMIFDMQMNGYEVILAHPERYPYMNVLERGWVEFMGTDTHNTMYAKALVDLSNNRKVAKVLEKYEFMNKEL